MKKMSSDFFVKTGHSSPLVWRFFPRFSKLTVTLYSF